MTLPNFLIIGAMKSGTSSLHNYLSGHPQIFMTARKELHFFTSDQLPWPQSCLPLAEMKNHSLPILQLYSKFFRDSPTDTIAIGEATTTYLHHPHVAQRIHQLLPQIKLICMLRNPVDRAYSHFYHQLRRGEEQRLTFDEVLQSDRLDCSEGYIRLGYYHQYLQRYFEQFPSHQIKVLVFEDLLRNQSQILNDVLGFLEVETLHSTQFPHTNQGWAPAFPWLNQWLIAQNPIIPLLQVLMPQRAQVTRLPPRFRQFIMKRIGRQQIEPLSRLQRSKAYQFFEDDIRSLETLLQRDLSVWNPNINHVSTQAEMGV